MLHPQLRIEQVTTAYASHLAQGAVITLHSLPFTIGRGFANHLRLDHGDISRRHACIRFQEEYYTLEDLASRNGTLLNGERLNPGDVRRLHEGDVVQLANVVSMVFVDPFMTVPRTDIRPMHARGLWLDPQAQIVLLDAARIDLPDQQYRLLALLYSRKGAVVTREEIAAALWATDADLTVQMLDNTVSRLRASLAPYAGGHEYIVTVRGRGYQFVPHP